MMLFMSFTVVLMMSLKGETSTNFKEKKWISRLTFGFGFLTLSFLRQII